MTSIDAATVAPHLRWLADCMKVGRPVLPAETWLHIDAERWWVDAGHVTAAHTHHLDLPAMAVPAQRFADAIAAAGEEVLDASVEGGKLHLKGRRFTTTMPIVGRDHTPNPPTRGGGEPVDDDVRRALGSFGRLETPHGVTICPTAAFVGSVHLFAHIGTQPPLSDDLRPSGLHAVIDARALSLLPDADAMTVAERGVEFVAGERWVRVQRRENEGYAIYKPGVWVTADPRSQQLMGDAEEVGLLPGDVVAEVVGRVIHQPRPPEQRAHMVHVTARNGEVGAAVKDAEGDSTAARSPLSGDYWGDGGFVIWHTALLSCIAAAGENVDIEVRRHGPAAILTLTGSDLTIVLPTIKETK